MRIFRYFSILLCVFLIGFYIYQNAPHYQIIKGTIFGTYYTVKIRTDNRDKNLKSRIEAKLDEINNQMSVFETNSEISQINRAGAQVSIPLSEGMRQVMKAASKVYTQSGGWFDPTLGRLVDLWGFGAGKNQSPTNAQISRELRNVGFNKLKFSSDFKRLRKSKKDIFVNLSAIAKGYGVDEVALLLENEGYQDYLVEIGGEIKAKGSRSPSGEAWNIGINKPVADSSENAMVVAVSNIAVATSGNYRNFYEKDGEILGHTISFKTGKPVLSDALSVSVFHDSCMYADAYATAIMAMGTEKGISFADKHKLKVVIIDNNFQPHLSQVAQQILGEQDWKK